MFSEGALRIEIHRGGKITVLDVQSDRALIGSGAHCDVRLAPDEAAVEQLAVETIDEEVLARTIALHRPCLLNGAPFIEGRLAPTAMLELGSVFVSVKFVAREVKEAKNAGQSATPPAVQAFALVALAVGFYFVLGKKPVDPLAVGGSVVTPPELTVAAETCPQTDRLAALSLANETMALAENKRERSPFYASDGIAAVQLFRRAASCYEQAGQTPAAEFARGASDELLVRLKDELHVRHVRLERLLAEQKYDEAKREGKMISEFIADSSHEYSQWLSAVVREGELRAQAGGHK